VRLTATAVTAPGSNVTFHARAIGVAAPLLYQWKHNGTDVAGAANDTLVLNNIRWATRASTRSKSPTVRKPTLATVHGDCLDKPVITSNPVPDRAGGANATFTVAAKSATPSATNGGSQHRSGR